MNSGGSLFSSHFYIFKRLYNVVYLKYKTTKFKYSDNAHNFIILYRSHLAEYVFKNKMSDYVIILNDSRRYLRS